MVTSEPSKTSQGADDFTLSKEAQIGSLEFFGSGSNPSTTLAVWIYADGGTAPGAEIFHQAGLAEAGTPNDFTVHLTGAPTLAPGSYWLSMQLSTFGYWDSLTAQVGDPAVWQNPGNGYGLGCPTYQPLAGCGASGKDFAFRVYAPDPVVVPPEGTGHKVTLHSGELMPHCKGSERAKKDGSGVATITCDEAGKLSIRDSRGSKIKRRSAAVVAGKAVKLAIAPTYRTKARLAKGKTVVVTPVVGFSGADGSVEVVAFPAMKLHAQQRAKARA